MSQCHVQHAAVQAMSTRTECIAFVAVAAIVALNIVVFCRPQLARGLMQLFSVEQQKSQPLEAHAAAFSTVKVGGVSKFAGTATVMCMQSWNSIKDAPQQSINCSSRMASSVTIGRHREGQCDNSMAAGQCYASRGRGCSCYLRKELEALLGYSSDHSTS